MFKCIYGNLDPSLLTNEQENISSGLSFPGIKRMSFSEKKTQESFSEMKQQESFSQNNRASSLFQLKSPVS